MINCVSWLDDYRALQDSPACVVVPIDKLSVLVIVLFSALVLREAVSPDSWRDQPQSQTAIRTWLMTLSVLGVECSGR